MHYRIDNKKIETGSYIEPGVYKFNFTIETLTSTFSTACLNLHAVGSLCMNDDSSIIDDHQRKTINSNIELLLTCVTTS